LNQTKVVDGHPPRGVSRQLVEVVQRHGFQALAWRRVVGFTLLAGVLALLIVAATALGLWLKQGSPDHGHAWDYPAALWVHSLRGSTMDLAMRFFGGAGEPMPMSLVCTAIVLAFYFRGHRLAALTAVVALPGSCLLWEVTCRLVLRERPGWWLAHNAADHGFPGGHVINATVIATVCAVAAFSILRAGWQKNLGLAASVLFVAGTFTSRIYESAHFLTDNLAGLAMGLCWAAVAIPVTRWMFPEVRNASAQLEVGP
jgi:membrane-associated phospholipid phosphatase